MSFIWHPWKWISSFWDYFGLSKKSAKLIFIGLDNAGKTTLMKKIKEGTVSQEAPTHHPSSEELRIGDITFIAYDLGGHLIARRLWKEFFPIADGIIFLIDAADSQRLDEARYELLELLTDEEISNIPILILGNKIDRPNALSEISFKNALGITNLCTGKGQISLIQGTRPIEVFMASIYCNFGYPEGFRWLSQYFNNQNQSS